MQRERIALTIIVDLDPTLGTFHTPKSAESSLQAMMLSYIPHYNPVVVLNEVPDATQEDVQRNKGFWRKIRMALHSSGR